MEEALLPLMSGVGARLLLVRTWALSHRDGYLANEKVACQELRNLVDAVNEERNAEGKSTIGRIPVSDATAEKAARRNPKTAWLADSGKLRAKNHARGPRTIDLDYSEQVLATCPK